MSKHPAIAYKEATKVVIHLGYKKKSHAGTSHVQYKHPETGKKITLPDYGKENYRAPLFGKICRDIGITKKEFFSILKK